MQAFTWFSLKPQKHYKRYFYNFLSVKKVQFALIFEYQGLCRNVLNNIANIIQSAEGKTNKNFLLLRRTHGRSTFYLFILLLLLVLLFQ